MPNLKMRKKLSILYITPGNPHLVTPEEGFARDLAKLGHNVILLKATTQYPPEVLNEKVDIIVGAMEQSMGLANFLGEKMNKPVYNHMEWIPPWRIGMEPVEKWGYEDETIEKVTPDMVERYKEMYSHQAEQWNKATVKSCAGYCLIPTIQPFVKDKIECFVKYYAPNIQKLAQYRNNTIKEKYQIMSTARLVPHKKIVHVVRALALIPKDIRPHYVVVGYGSEQPHILKEAASLGVSMEIAGSGDGGLKEQIIQESMFSVNIWAGIPIAESFYFKKPAISYSDPHMIEVFGNDSVDWVEPNNIEELSNAIIKLLDKDCRMKRGLNGHELMMSNTIGMGTPEKLARDVEAILYKGVEKWNQ